MCDVALTFWFADDPGAVDKRVLLVVDYANMLTGRVSPAWAIISHVFIFGDERKGSSCFVSTFFPPAILAFPHP
jgi:hypothetical protein